MHKPLFGSSSPLASSLHIAGGVLIWLSSTRPLTVVCFAYAKTDDIFPASPLCLSLYFFILAEKVLRGTNFGGFGLILNNRNIYSSSFNFLNNITLDVSFEASHFLFGPMYCGSWLYIGSGRW
jgi:hypothetical protein